MSSIDPVHLSKTMARLLRHQPERAEVRPDGEGWFSVDDVATAASDAMGIEVSSGDIAAAVEQSGGPHFELAGDRIRTRKRSQKRGRKRVFTPDILYHATTRERAERARQAGALTVGRNRSVYLSTTEPEAWRAAHRMVGGEPVVLYIDASHARRRGIRFTRNRRNGLFVARTIPASFVLNLQERFAEQLSAGGIPVCRGEDGKPRVALIRVSRRSGVTWEVAKGKLETGEVPEETAVREVQEEMGLSCGLSITRHLGEIRYGFVAPGGLPRLKTVYLYLMSPDGPMESFVPAEGEGIREVQWFTPDEACRLVTHTSLIPLMHRARRILDEETEHGSRTSR